MTSTVNAVDPTSYSIRQCRCGVEMHRLVPGSRHTWQCPACGRQHR